MNIVNFDGYEYDSLSTEIWADNYRHESEATRVDTWDRVAASCAAPEDVNIRGDIEAKFKKILYNDRFVSGGRILANIGNTDKKTTTLYNCYVHHPHDIGMYDCDSIDGIYSMLKAQAKTLQSEGGYGVNASWIRPSGAYVAGIGSRSPGPIKFMELWDKSSEIITAGSKKIHGTRRKGEKVKIRKGAQMLVLNVWHPDIREFIVAKQQPNVLSKFNVSVGITEGFIEAVKGDLDWDLKYPDTEHPEYASEWKGFIEDWEAKGLPVIVYETVKAVDIWNMILEATYNRAEPGVLFLDHCNKLNPLAYAEKIAATNPCGEIPQSTGVCNIGSINLVTFVKNVEGELQFDFDEFRETVTTAIRFLDNINDISTTPLPEYTKAVQEKRRIGLGVMGLGSLHMMMAMPYGSEESVNFQRKIARIKAETELLASAKLGREKGNFSLFDANEYFNSYYFTNLDISPEVKKEIVSIGCMRNSHQSMNAPTGNTGIYARNVSGGIEPVFSVDGYYRWCIVPETRQRELIAEGFKYPDISKGEWYETDIFKFSLRGNEQVLAGEYDGDVYEIDKGRGLIIRNYVEDYGVKFAKSFYNNFDEMRACGQFPSVAELNVEAHINSLKVWASYTNMAISKTVNLPSDYTFDDFKNVYMSAWDSNIKGITTYREGTMTAVLESQGNSKQNKKIQADGVLVDTSAPKRPKDLDAEVHHVKISGENWTIFVGLQDGRPREVFGGVSENIQLPKKIKNGILSRTGKVDGRGVYSFITGTGEDQIIVKDIVKSFANSDYAFHTLAVSGMLRHGMPIHYILDILHKAYEDSDLYSFNKVLSRVLKKHIKDGTVIRGKCINCASENIVYQEGCMVCRDCGSSKCS